MAISYQRTHNRQSTIGYQSEKPRNLNRRQRKREATTRRGDSTTRSIRISYPKKLKVPCLRERGTWVR